LPDLPGFCDDQNIAGTLFARQKGGKQFRGGRKFVNRRIAVAQSRFAIAWKN
jgi:hypothetical protein